MRARGTGSLRKKPHGGWQITYSKNGIMVSESVARMYGKAPSKVTRAEAERALRRRLEEIARNTYMGPKAERATIGEIMDDYLADLKLRKGQAAVDDLRSIKARLTPLLDARASTLKTRAVVDWMEDQKAAGYADGSINHGVGLLSAVYHYAWKTEKIARRPYLPRLELRNARQGFFTREEFETVTKHLPPVAADLARIAYLTGCRRSELLWLRWEHVDRTRGLMVFTDTKNGDDRPVPLRDDTGALLEVGEVIERRWKARAATGMGPWVFTTKRGKRLGPTVLLRAWARACKAAGFWEAASTQYPNGRPAKLLHDLRRTFARDATDAGVSQAVVMRQGGWRSDTMFRRYRIVDTADLRRAQRMLTAHRGQG